MSGVIFLGTNFSTDWFVHIVWFLHHIKKYNSYLDAILK